MIIKKGITGHNMLQNLLIHLNNPDVDKVSKLFFKSQLAPLDFNLALWEANDREMVKIDGDDIKLLAETLNPWSVNTDLQEKIFHTVEHYDKFGKYVPEVEFFSWAINAFQDEVYQRSAIIGALNWCEDAGLIHSVEAINPIDADKKDPNKFKFYYITERPDGVSNLFALANAERK